MISPLQFALLSIFGLSLSVGQILFKFAAIQENSTGEPLGIVSILFTLPMIAACILYGLTVILYVYLLQEVPLSRAYLFSILGSALVPILALILFDEPLSLRYLIGAALVFSGVVISSTG